MSLSDTIGERMDDVLQDETDMEVVSDWLVNELTGLMICGAEALGATQEEYEEAVHNLADAVLTFNYAKSMGVEAAEQMMENLMVEDATLSVSYHNGTLNIKVVKPDEDDNGWAVGMDGDSGDIILTPPSIVLSRS
jgi:hypothetical protein